jgi:hypothetical protein
MLRSSDLRSVIYWREVTTLVPCSRSRTRSRASAAAASTATAKLKALGLAVEPDINDPERELRVTLHNVPDAEAAFEWLDAHLARIGGDVLTWQVSRLDRVWSGLVSAE